MKSSRILVTGGAGFIGSHLVKRLLNEGYCVTVLDNYSSGRKERIKDFFGNKKFNSIHGDVRNANDVNKSLKNIDIVFHLAAVVDVSLSIKKPELVNDVNLNGTLNLLEGSFKNKLNRFIYISTCAVYGEANQLPINEEFPTNPISPYGVSKLSAEHYCRIYRQIYGISTTSLRLFNVYGSGQKNGDYNNVMSNFIQKVIEGKSPIIYGDGKQTRDFIHVNDVVEACLLSMKCQLPKYETINIGTGKSTSIEELAKIIIRTFYQGNEYDLLNPIYEEPKKGDVKNSYANISKAQKLLNFYPKIKLKYGIKEL